MRALSLLLLVWFQFAIVTVNYRAIAQKRYAAAGITDAVIAVAGFTLLKLIAVSDTVPDVIGYAIGSVLGGLTGIWVTKHWEAK